MIIELIKEGTSPDPIKAMAIAASKCYDSKPTEGLVHRVLQTGHTSIAEHAKFEFNIKGISRVSTHQLVRKRIGFSYSMRSQRYCDEEDFGYTLPKTIFDNTRLAIKYNKLVADINDFYEKMINEGIPKEDARYILPNATHSTLILSCNLRSLIDFCGQRMCKRSQHEIRDLANKMKSEIERYYPSISQYLTPKCITLKNCPEGKKSCGYHQSK